MIEPYTIKLKNNKFKLFISLPKLDKTSLKRISIILENLNIIKNINDFFENVFIIINDKSKGEILQKIENEALDDIFGKNNNNYKVEIKYIFNIDSYYDMNKDSEQIINIFNYQQNLGEENEYFFILDSHNKIISIKNELELLIKKVSFVIFKLSKFINKDSSSNTDIDLMSFLKEKESIKQKNNDILKEILYFISKLKKLDYLFDLNFDISFNASVNEELTDIIIRRINLVKVEGEFRTKEYQIINKLLNSFDLPKDKINFNLKEIQTIDIEIDFTDMKCTKCSKSIPEDKFLYYCFLCKTKYCLECVHEQLKKKGKEKFTD
jgi:Zn finger protein HypA/HybF involved in hydrogenase expression